MKSNTISFLNERQQEAVISEKKRLLVLAGAGSGKTKTLIQKIIYLIEEKNVKPSEILAITFTKNAANEMLDRLILSADSSREYEQVLTNKLLNFKEKDKKRIEFKRKIKWVDGINIRTFHSFCYTILRNHGVKEFDNQFKIIGDEKRNDNDEFSKHIAPELAFEVMYKLLLKRCEDNLYLIKLKKYVLDHLVTKIRKHSNALLSYNEDKRFITLDGTKVRSKSEQYIADWLFRHSIEYFYEPELNVKDFDFRPDFYILGANLYIEHISNKSYPTQNKEIQFQKGRILYVKTFETMTLDSTLFNNTLDKIIKNRIHDSYYYNRTLSFQEEFKSYLVEVKDFVTLCLRITDMIKVENSDLNNIKKEASKDQHERVRNFYELALPLIEDYKTYCIDKSYLDFNDLIIRSNSVIKSQKDISTEYKRRFKYILVDEFQDVNNLQVDLLKLILTRSTQLFCVGDDWQSIYGFRGSNVSYIVEFEKHFKPSSVIKLNLNYRSTNHIVSASNEVIKHNKFKLDKEIFASRKSEHKIVVFAGNTEEENIQFCVERIKELRKEGIEEDEILFLYRRNHMFNPNAYSNKPSYLKTFLQEKIKIQNKTIHASKGLEAKVVFIIGLSEGYGGFPDIWMEDRIFQVIKKTNHDELMEEERRLFYVALTRAKDKLYLITEKGNESSFLREIPEHYTVKTLVSTSTKEEMIKTCSNCYSELEKLWKVCPYCGKSI